MWHIVISPQKREALSWQILRVNDECTRNMAVGASFADLAVILVDASKGVLVQTRRHTRICALMGIKHVVYAVNKMDLIDYDENEFKNIAKQIKIMTGEYDFEDHAYYPGICNSW